MGAQACVWRSEDYFQEVLCFNHRRPWDGTWIFGLGDNLYQLSHLTVLICTGVIDCWCLLMYWSYQRAIRIELVQTYLHVNFLNKNLIISYTKFGHFFDQLLIKFFSLVGHASAFISFVCWFYLLNLNMSACLPFGVTWLFIADWFTRCSPLSNISLFRLLLLFKNKISHFVEMLRSLSAKAQRATGSWAFYVNVYTQDEQSGLILGPSTLTAPS